MIRHLQCSVFETYARIIAHQVNCMGVMGSGVAGKVKKNFPDVYSAYKYTCDCYESDRIKLLGHVQLCPTLFDADKTPRVFVANMFAQYDYGRDHSRVYIDYAAFNQCLHQLADLTSVNNWTIAMPYRIGCARGNGDWEGKILPMINDVLGEREVLLCEYPTRWN